MHVFIDSNFNEDTSPCSSFNLVGFIHMYIYILIFLKHMPVLYCCWVGLLLFRESKSKDEGEISQATSLHLVWQDWGLQLLRRGSNDRRRKVTVISVFLHEISCPFFLRNKFSFLILYFTFLFNNPDKWGCCVTSCREVRVY